MALASLRVHADLTEPSLLDTGLPGSNMNKAKYSTRISIKIIVYSDDISLALIERVTMIDR